jgi:hypothetical protein
MKDSAAVECQVWEDIQNGVWKDWIQIHRRVAFMGQQRLMENVHHKMAHNDGNING